MYCIQQVPQVLVSPTNEGASGMSRDGFFIVRVDSLRVGIFAGFACFKDMGSSAVPLRGVVGVVVSAFLLTPFLTCQVKKKLLFYFQLFLLATINDHWCSRQSQTLTGCTAEVIWTAGAAGREGGGITVVRSAGVGIAVVVVTGAWVGEGTPIIGVLSGTTAGKRSLGIKHKMVKYHISSFISMTRHVSAFTSILHCLASHTYLKMIPA